MVGLTVTDVYSVRFEPKIPLPKLLKDNIAKLRITPAPYTPVRVNKRNHSHRYHNNTSSKQNWEALRKDILENYVRKIKQQDDPVYAEIFRIFNKVAPGNVEHLASDAIELMEKRDDEFRIRICILLFDKAITQPGIAEVMAECARFFNMAIPEVSEYLLMQISMFPTLYDMTETVTIDSSNTIDPFDEKLVRWTKQKDKRRGYARFMMALFSKELIPEAIVKNALDQIIADLNETSKQPKTPQTEENTTQYIEFVFEASSKVTGDLKEQLKTCVEQILNVPKEEFKAAFPSINMKSKFKLEDALKELNKKE